MRTLLLAAAALLPVGAALADPPATAGHATVTGAVDSPKTTTSANERATTDAAGLGAPLPGTKPVPAPGTPPKRHRHHRPH
jgi:hypothetical protein